MKHRIIEGLGYLIPEPSLKVIGTWIAPEVWAILVLIVGMWILGMIIAFEGFTGLIDHARELWNWLYDPWPPSKDRKNNK